MGTITGSTPAVRPATRLVWDKAAYLQQFAGKLLPGFDRLEAAYRERSSGKSVFELLFWKLTGLDLKLQQYRRGEAFAKAVFDAHGMDVLNLVWKGPEQMPRLEELADAGRWYRRVAKRAA